MKKIYKIIITGGVVLLTCFGMMACGDNNKIEAIKNNGQYEIMSKVKIDINDSSLGETYIYQIKDKQGNEFKVARGYHCISITQIR